MCSQESSAWRLLQAHKGWRGANHGGRTKRSNGTERNRHEASAGFCPGHPRFVPAEGDSIQMEAIREMWPIVCWILVALCFVTPNPAQSASSSGDPMPASEVKYRHPVLETSRFIAYLLEIPPNHATLMHRHDRDILSVFVSGAKTTSSFYGREPVTDALPSGESRFREAGFTHATRNDDSVVFRSVILEFAQPQGAVRARSDEQRYCNEGSPTACVMEKQQLCTEGFCVTEIRMAPGAIRKASARDAGYAMIAVNTCELSVG